jgi:hypothetical protein
MKKNFVLFIVLFIFGIYNVSHSQFKIIMESDLQIKKIVENYSKKNINTVSTYRYDIDSGVVSKDFEKISLEVLDLNKNTITEINYYPNFSRTVMTFNSDNNITNISTYYSDNTLTSKVITIYETDSKVKEKIYYFGVSMTFKSKNTYSSGNIVRQDNVDSLEKNLGYSKMYYNNSGNLIEEDKFNTDDSLEIVYQFSYDNSGNCTEEVINYPSVNYPSVNYTNKIIHKYNGKGIKTESTEYGIEGKLTLKSKYKYNDIGLLIEESSYSFDNKLIKKSEYKYDENGNKSEWKFVDLIEGIEYLYKYVYNEK